MNSFWREGAADSSQRAGKIQEAALEAKEVASASERLQRCWESVLQAGDRSGCSPDRPARRDALPWQRPAAAEATQSQRKAAGFITAIRKAAPKCTRGKYSFLETAVETGQR